MLEHATLNTILSLIFQYKGNNFYSVKKWFCWMLSRFSSTIMILLLCHGLVVLPRFCCIVLALLFFVVIPWFCHGSLVLPWFCCFTMVLLCPRGSVVSSWFCCVLMVMLCCYGFVVLPLFCCVPHCSVELPLFCGVEILLSCIMVVSLWRYMLSLFCCVAMVLLCCSGSVVMPWFCFQPVNSRNRNRTVTGVVICKICLSNQI